MYSQLETPLKTLMRLSSDLRWKHPYPETSLNLFLFISGLENIKLVHFTTSRFPVCFCTNIICPPALKKYSFLLSSTCQSSCDPLDSSLLPTWGSANPSVAVPLTFNECKRTYRTQNMNECTRVFELMVGQRAAHEPIITALMSSPPK